MPGGRSLVRGDGPYAARVETVIAAGTGRCYLRSVSGGDYVSERMRRWRRWTDGPLTILAIGSLPILLLELERERLPSADRAVIDVVNVAVLVAFAADYLVELVVASNRRAYVRRERIGALIVVTSAVALVPALSAAPKPTFDPANGVWGPWR